MKDLTTVKQRKATTVQDRSEKCLTEKQKILNRWTEYCSELYNPQGQWRSISIELSPDTQRGRPPHPSQRRGGCNTQSLKKGKSVGVDKIPVELAQSNVEDVITAVTTICDKIWQRGEWPIPCTQSLVITLPKKGNLQQCQNYRTISLIIHPSKIMLKITMNRFKPQAQKISAEEQAGFRAGKSTTEQMFNLRILCEKHLQHQ